MASGHKAFVDKAFGYRDRAHRLERLAREELDVLVVGGGITGVAVARDAAMRGFSVACVEKEDFAYGTSSRSSKLIHGGLRYLEQANFRLVFEGTHERATQRKVAPHLVRPIPFLVPVYEGAKHGVLMLGMGLWMYDTLAGRRRHARHSRHGRRELLAKEPGLRAEGLTGGAIYYDCATDDARLCVENAVSAHEAGAVMVNRATFLAPVRDESGRVAGALVRDELSGAEIRCRCKALVCCAGPWTDQVRRRCGDHGDMIRATKGIHLLVARERLPVRHAVVMSARADRRVTFAIPRGPVTLIGTTDTDHDGDPDDVFATPEDVEYLLETVAWYFPSDPPTARDIRATYAGLRPLVRDDAGSPYDVSREHTVTVSGDGTVVVGGGKYTTYRRIAADVVEAAMKAIGLARKERPGCPTRDAVLPGGAGYTEQAADEMAAALVAGGLPEEVADRLVEAYGVRAQAVAGLGPERISEELPYCWGEVEHGLEEEAATSLDDVLVRRLPVFFEAPDQGLECVERIADRMAMRLGWDEERRRAEVERYRATVALSRRWRG